MKIAFFFLVAVFGLVSCRFRKGDWGSGIHVWTPKLRGGWVAPKDFGDVVEDITGRRTREREGDDDASAVDPFNGTVTLSQLQCIMIRLGSRASAQLGPLNTTIKKYGITSAKRVAAFLAQVKIIIFLEF
jgi:hypothetical protein